MIEVNGLSKSFGTKAALSRVSFKAKKGDIVAFLGVNGAGKTTTMRLLVGYLSPTEGHVLVNGLNPTDDRLLVTRSLGYMPENNPLYPDMTVAEYLDFVAGTKKTTPDPMLIGEIGLEAYYHSPIGILSRGYRQRVGLAAALTGDPALLILDEPTTGLDPVEQDVIRSLIKRLAKHKTVFFSTHILSEAEELATRIIILSQGRLVFDGPKPKGRGSVATLFKKSIKQHQNP